jgi:RNase H-like domain found in reverse transcriptase/Integrase zinc binding domain
MHHDQAWRPLGFFSQKLSAVETRYSAFDRELLAVYSGILNFRHVLEGRNFTIFTNHMPLLGALTRVSGPRSDRQRRQLSVIAEFSTELRHISGHSNVVADTLFRPPVAAAVQLGDGTLPGGPQAGLTVPVAAVGLLLQPGGPQAGLTNLVATGGPLLQPGISTATAATSAGALVARAAQPPVDVRDVAAAQAGCPDCQRAKASPSFRVVKVEVDGQLVDISSGVMRPLVPQQFCRRIFDAVHGLAHPGIRATKWLISNRYLWPDLAIKVTS